MVVGGGNPLPPECLLAGGGTELFLPCIACDEVAYCVTVLCCGLAVLVKPSVKKAEVLLTFQSISYPLYKIFSALSTDQISLSEHLVLYL